VRRTDGVLVLLQYGLERTPAFGGVAADTTKKTQVVRSVDEDLDIEEVAHLRGAKG
jgi:hypothetical protein